MKAKTWSRIGLALFVGGLVAFFSLRFIHPHFIGDTLSDPNNIAPHIDCWLTLALGCACTALLGLILWITAGLKSKND
jgi:hypothetical protein